MKYLLFLFLFAPCFMYGQANPGQGEVSASYGLWSFSQIFGSEHSGSGGQYVSDATGSAFATYSIT